MLDAHTHLPKAWWSAETPSQQAVLTLFSRGGGCVGPTKGHSVKYVLSPIQNGGVGVRAKRPPPLCYPVSRGSYGSYISVASQPSLIRVRWAWTGGLHHKGTPTSREGAIQMGQPHYPPTACQWACCACTVPQYVVSITHQGGGKGGLHATADQMVLIKAILSPSSLSLCLPASLSVCLR